jgi:hypothetical protein
MKATVRDSQVLRSVRPDDLQQYLTSHGWIAGQHPNHLAAIYNRQIDGTEFELLVPLSRDLRDFSERMSEVLRTLETVEKRDQLQILSDLTSARADVVRIRRPGADDGTILLEDGVSLVNSASDMILAAACTTITPRLYYPGKKPTAATDYLHKTRLGQSERGSYVLTVISPVPPRTADELFPGMHDPFERQVTRMLSTALDATVEASEAALRSGNHDPFRDSMNQGISANLIDAVLGLMGPQHQPVGVNFSWSPEHPIAFQPGPTVSIETDFVPVLEEASRFLKRSAQLPAVELVGVVIGLRRPEGEETGRATLIAFIDGKPKTVTLELGPQDYDLAIQAHQAHSTVICHGELVRMGRATVLTNMTNFRLAPEPEQEPEQETDLFS